MARGVFVIRADSPYEDEPAERYQFPSQYLSRASEFIGDWILYYEPVKAGARGYHAAAQVQQIVPDPTRSAHYLAFIEAGSYVTFERDVPRLVWFAAFDNLQEARARELQMKKWKRAWKLREIEAMNPDWHDLYPTLV